MFLISELRDNGSRSGVASFPVRLLRAETVEGSAAQRAPGLRQDDARESGFARGPQQMVQSERHQDPERCSSREDDRQIRDVDQGGSERCGKNNGSRDTAYYNNNLR